MPAEELKLALYSFTKQFIMKIIPELNRYKK
jgi:hypothetical protein